MRINIYQQSDKRSIPWHKILLDVASIFASRTNILTKHDDCLGIQHCLIFSICIKTCMLTYLSLSHSTYSNLKLPFKVLKVFDIKSQKIFSEQISAKLLLYATLDWYSYNIFHITHDKNLCHPQELANFLKKLHTNDLCACTKIMCSISLYTNNK